MEPHERTHLVTSLMEEATHMQTVLKHAIAAKAQEANQIDAGGHIPDEQPHALPISTLEEEYAAWKNITQALAIIQTELRRIEQATHQRLVA